MQITTKIVIEQKWLLKIFSFFLGKKPRFIVIMKLNKP